VIMDFGLARRTVDKGAARLTHSGLLIGTPAYMSPEQMNGDVKAMGPGCDIYSLGVICYELLTGRRPFRGDLGVLIARVVLGPPPPPRQVRPDLDPELEAVCLKALAKKPAERFASMRDFAAALEAFLARPRQQQPAGRAQAPVAHPIANAP